MRGLTIAVLVLLSLAGPPADAAIYRWDNGELITERDPEPHSWYIDLIYADLVGAQFAGSEFVFSDLSWAHLMGANLRGVAFEGCELSNADLSGANATHSTFLESSLLHTDFSGANLRGAEFTYSPDVRSADFSGAVVTAARFNDGTLRAEQLYSTASYQSGNLGSIALRFNNLNGWDFAGKNLAGADFESALMHDTDFRGANLTNASLVNAELVRADLRGANLAGVTPWDQLTVTSPILPDGRIEGLRLNGRLRLRDYSYEPAVAVTVESAMELGPDALLHMLFEDDRWSSTISFEPGINVSLDGTLELSFHSDAHPLELIGTTFDLFDWEGVDPTGQFAEVIFPTRTKWDLSQLNITGEVTLLAVPEPGSILMLLAGGMCLLAIGHGKNRRMKERLP